MIAALIIVFREILEAGMIVGIVLAATRGVVASRLWIGGGIAAGVLGSFVAAGCIGVITAAFSGMGQELLNATILSIAVVMLATHNIWMSRHGRDLARHIQATGEAVSAHRKSLAALAIVVGLAVLREGSEVALFLYGSIAAGGSSALSMIAGGMLGLAGGAALTDLFWTSADTGKAAVSRDKCAHCFYRCQHGGSGSVFPRTSRCCDHIRCYGLGQFRAHAAGRLYRKRSA